MLALRLRTSPPVIASSSRLCYSIQISAMPGSAPSVHRLAYRSPPPLPSAMDDFSLPSHRSRQNVALIAGVTGVVGGSLVQHLTGTQAPAGPWKVYGIARRPPRWPADSALQYVQCDLLNKEQTEQKLEALHDVTHLFYVTWTARSTEEENCTANGAMLRNLLDPLLNHAKGLKHVCLQTGIKHYLGSHLGFDGCTRVLIYHEDMPRLQGTNFYYVQEDILFDAVNRKKGQLTWSVHRPGIIFGLSPDSVVNATIGLAVYGSICKHEGEPLVFTGTQATWESHVEISDANMIAEQEVWAATNVHTLNQAFNSSNGDDVSWKEIWSVVAEYFGIEAVFGGQPQSFVDMMQGKTHVWDAIVKKHELEPTKLEDFLGGWQIFDIVLQKLPTGRSSMKKSAEYGFCVSKSSTESLRFWFDRMRDKRLIP